PPPDPLTLRPAEQVLDVMAPFVGRDDDRGAAGQRLPESPVEVEVVVGGAVVGVRRILRRGAAPDPPVALAVHVARERRADPAVPRPVVPVVVPRVLVDETLLRQ